MTPVEVLEHQRRLAALARRLRADRLHAEARMRAAVDRLLAVPIHIHPSLLFRKKKP